MSWFWTIFIIVFFVIPLIKAKNDKNAAPGHQSPDTVFPDIDDEEETEYYTPVETPLDTVPDNFEEAIPTTTTPVHHQTPLSEPEPEDEGVKIDPVQMIIGYEIMKPKWEDEQ